MAAAISPRPNAFHALSSESSASLFSGTSEPRKLPFTVSVTSESAASVITLLYDGRRFTAIPRVAATNTPRHGYQQRTLTRQTVCRKTHSEQLGCCATHLRRHNSAPWRHHTARPNEAPRAPTSDHLPRRSRVFCL